MEAGIEPAPPPLSRPSAYSTAVDLCNICTVLIQHLQLSYSMKERTLITNLLSTVNTHMILNIQTTPHNSLREFSTEFHSKTIHYHNYIWSQLTTALHSTGARRNIINFLKNLEQFHSATITESPLAPPGKFHLPTNKAFPSISEQVISDPTAILDTYKLSL